MLRLSRQRMANPFIIPLIIAPASLSVYPAKSNMAGNFHLHRILSIFGSPQQFAVYSSLKWTHTN